MNFQNFKNMDSFILLSLTNTRLRDFNDDLEDFLLEFDLPREEFLKKLSDAGFYYDEETRQFK